MKDKLTETLKACLRSAKSIEDLTDKLISEGVTLQHCTENVQSDSLKNDLLKSEFWRLNEESGIFELDRDKTARNLQRMGYRKSSEVVDEVIKRLLDAFPECNRDNKCPAIYYDDYRSIIEECGEELKKKYTEEGK